MGGSPDRGSSSERGQMATKMAQAGGTRIKQDFNSLSKPPSPIGQLASDRWTNVVDLFNPFNGGEK